MTSSDQAQIQGFELTHPNIYPTDELLEGMYWPVLLIQNYRTLRPAWTFPWQAAFRQTESAPTGALFFGVDGHL